MTEVPPALAGTPSSAAAADGVEITSAWRRTLGSWFGIDPRSMAALRVGTATMVLVDLGVRAQNIRTFYTDAGVLPRVELLRKVSGVESSAFKWWWSIHLVSGQVWFQAALFLIAAVFAFQLLVGYRTRRAAVLTYLLLASLQYRNSVISHGGDVLLRALCFWLMWVPSGVRWSVDAALARGAPLRRRVLTIGTAGLLLQLVAMYVVTGLIKTDPVWQGPIVHGPDDAWKSTYSATWMAMNNEHFATALAHWLAERPELCWYLTIAAIHLELYGAGLAFSPVATGWLRLLCVVLFWGFHLGLIATIRLGHFPFTVMVYWLAFLPAEFWGLMARWWRPAQSAAGLELRHAADDASQNGALLVRSAFGLDTVPVVPDATLATGWVLIDGDARAAAPLKRLGRASPILGPVGRLVPGWASDGGTARWLAGRCERPEKAQPTEGFVTGLVCAMCVVYVALWNLREVDDAFKHPRPERWLPAGLDAVGRVTGMNQEWGMFAPYPQREVGWYQIEATLGNGHKVDLWPIIDGRFDGMNDAELYASDHPLNKDWPAQWVDSYPDEDWQKYMANLCYERYSSHRGYLITYLRREWQRRIDATPGYSALELARFDRDIASLTRQLDTAKARAANDKDTPAEHDAAVRRVDAMVLEVQRQADGRTRLLAARGQRELVGARLTYFIKRIPKDPRRAFEFGSRTLWTWPAPAEDR